MNSVALLVIDVQVGLITGAYREQETIEAINQVIRKIRAIDGDVIFIRCLIFQSYVCVGK